jgi:hypothetical protein
MRLKIYHWISVLITGFEPISCPYHVLQLESVEEEYLLLYIQNVRIKIESHFYKYHSRKTPDFICIPTTPVFLIKLSNTVIMEYQT